jgi:hypothetical protein
MATKKLELVPAENKKATAFENESAKGSSYSVLESVMGGEDMPPADELVKVTLPTMLDLKTVPIGTTFSGKVIRLVENFTGKSDMRKARLLYMRHRSGAEFLLPLTGVIKNALKQFLIEDPAGKKATIKQLKESGASAKDLSETELCDFYTLSPELLDKTLYIRRMADRPSKKFAGKPMYDFQILLHKG